MHYKGTEEELRLYDQQVTTGEGYYANDNWANPIEIDGEWYILKHTKYDANMELVNELPKQEDIV